MLAQKIVKEINLSKIRGCKKPERAAQFLLHPCCTESAIHQIWLSHILELRAEWHKGRAERTAAEVATYSRLCRRDQPYTLNQKAGNVWICGQVPTHGEKEDSQIWLRKTLGASFAKIWICRSHCSPIIQSHCMCMCVCVHMCWSHLHAEWIGKEL